MTSTILFLCYLVVVFQNIRDAHASCMTGQYYDASSDACIPCAVGTYTASTRATSCIPCNSDSYTTATGQSTCIVCPVGRGGSQCTTCGAGTYKSIKGVSTCTSCLPGTYSMTVGATSVSTCIQCAKGTYNSEFGSSKVCDSCPSNTVSPVGAGYASDCMAKEGYYGLPGLAATICPSGSYCPASTMKPIPCPSGSISETAGRSTCSILSNTSTTILPGIDIKTKLTEWGSFDFIASVCWAVVMVLGIILLCYYQNYCFYGVFNAYNKKKVISIPIQC